MKHHFQAVRLAALIVSIGVGICQPASAAPFCIQNQVLPPQCMFYDVRQCQREAQHQNAECSANPAELKVSQNQSEYCVVTSSLISVCAYVDRQSCAVAAERQHGTCIQSNNRPARQPNPFSPVNGN
jgi:hypothetical protein